MILVFGGTTEGRRAAEVLEEAGSSYYYSTKTGEQELALHHGVRTDGAMDGEAMRQFIREHAIRLVVDAAHPFAATLHQTISEVAADTIESIRQEILILRGLTTIGRCRRISIRCWQRLACRASAS